jgi:hypothetical protein
LSSIPVGRDSATPQAAASAMLPARTRGETAAGQGRPAVHAVSAAAAAAPQATKANRPAHVLFRFQGSRGPAADWPISEAIPSPQASTPQTAAAIQRRSWNTSTSPSTAAG